jgi:hypothetical protein
VELGEGLLFHPKKGFALKIIVKTAEIIKIV